MNKDHIVSFSGGKDSTAMLAEKCKVWWAMDGRILEIDGVPP